MNVVATSIEALQRASDNKITHLSIAQGFGAHQVQYNKEQRWVVLHFSRYKVRSLVTTLKDLIDTKILYNLQQFLTVRARKGYNLNPSNCYKWRRQTSMKPVMPDTFFCQEWIGQNMTWNMWLVDGHQKCTSGNWWYGCRQSQTTTSCFPSNKLFRNNWNIDLLKILTSWCHSSIILGKHNIPGQERLWVCIQEKKSYCIFT